VLYLGKLFACSFLGELLGPGETRKRETPSVEGKFVTRGGKGEGREGVLTCSWGIGSDFHMGDGKDARGEEALPPPLCTTNPRPSSFPAPSI
jgi:hypothetical protein